jgi:hypothetical protein
MDPSEKRNRREVWRGVLTPVIAATWEVEMGGLQSQAGPSKSVKNN